MPVHLVPPDVARVTEKATKATKCRSDPVGIQTRAARLVFRIFLYEMPRFGGSIPSQLKRIHADPMCIPCALGGKSGMNEWMGTTSTSSPG
jgi:hypothetical protein